MKPSSSAGITFRAARLLCLMAVLVLPIQAAFSAGQRDTLCDEKDAGDCHDGVVHLAGQQGTLCNGDDAMDCQDGVLDIRMPEIHLQAVMEGLNGSLENMEATLTQMHKGLMGASSEEARRAYKVAIQELLESSGPHGFLGIALTSLSPELREHFGVDREVGIMVSRVEHDSPAEEAGLEVGDIIIAVDGQDVESTGDLFHAVGSKKKDDQIDIDLVRDGRTLTLTATLAERQRFLYNVGPLFRSEGHEGTGQGDTNHKFDFRFNYAPEALRGALKNLQSLSSNDQWKVQMRQEEQRNKEIEQKMEALEKRLQELEGELEERNRK